mmetsp:Transcript_30566/g.65869  ORF Transcript_30566/g.65869 Transcript_30566/m.65869 type:complete len:588 (+) Transcript_30566:148-1911(+)
MTDDPPCPASCFSAARPQGSCTSTDDVLPRLLSQRMHGSSSEKRYPSRSPSPRTSPPTRSIAAKCLPACLSGRRAESPPAANRWRASVPQLEGTVEPSSIPSEEGEDILSSPFSCQQQGFFDSGSHLGSASVATGIIDLRWTPWGPFDCVAHEHDEIFDASVRALDGSTIASGGGDSSHESSFQDGCTSPRLCNELVPAAVATWLACSYEAAQPVQGRCSSRTLEDAEASLWGRTRTTPTKAATSAHARPCWSSIDLQREPGPVLTAGAQVPMEVTKSSRPPPPTRVPLVQSNWRGEGREGHRVSASRARLRFRKVVWCVLGARWIMKLSQLAFGHEANDTCPRNLSRLVRETSNWPIDSMVQLIDLDLGRTFTGDAVVLQRRGWIRTMLLHHVSSDPALGYCQGMTLVAAIFAAASHSESEAYGRFSAFLCQFRSLWLPGFPLLRSAAQHFEQIVESKAWHKHFERHGIDTSMYLPQALLTLFGCWLPLSTILECLELLETRQLAGLVAMAVAVLDLASARLLAHRTLEELMCELQALKNSPPSSRLLLTTTQNILSSLEASDLHSNFQIQMLSALVAFRCGWAGF